MRLLPNFVHRLQHLVQGLRHDRVGRFGDVDTEHIYLLLSRWLQYVKLAVDHACGHEVTGPSSYPLEQNLFWCVEVNEVKV